MTLVATRTLVATLLMNVTLLGQSPRPIDVLVTDPQGKPVPGATVRLALAGPDGLRWVPGA